MKKFIVFILSFIISISISNAECYSEVVNNSDAIVGGSFEYILGSKGISNNSKIYGGHYIIEYDSSVLDIVKDEIKSYYNWNNLDIATYSDDNSNMSALIIDVSTNNKKNYITSDKFDSNAFIPMISIKFKVKDNNLKNTIINVKYRYREVGGTWSGWTNVNTTVISGKFTCSDVILSLDNTKSFEFEIQATDKLDSNASTTSIDVGQAIFLISSNKKACYINGQEILMYDVVDTW